MPCLLADAGVLPDTVRRLGHRNWIVIADGAYPCHSARGVTTVTTDAGIPEVLTELVAALRSAGHVRPVAWLDTELALLTDDLAPGIEEYRDRIRTLLRGVTVQSALHSELIRRVGSAAAQFEVLVVKTRTHLPYASVFIELDCAYWDAQREDELRSLLTRGK